MISILSFALTSTMNMALSVCLCVVINTCVVTITRDNATKQSRSEASVRTQTLNTCPCCATVLSCISCDCFHCTDGRSVQRAPEPNATTLEKNFIDDCSA